MCKLPILILFLFSSFQALSLVPPEATKVTELNSDCESPFCGVESLFEAMKSARLVASATTTFGKKRQMLFEAYLENDSTLVIGTERLGKDGESSVFYKKGIRYPSSTTALVARALNPKDRLVGFGKNNKWSPHKPPERDVNFFVTASRSEKRKLIDRRYADILDKVLVFIPPLFIPYIWLTAQEVYIEHCDHVGWKAFLSPAGDRANFSCRLIFQRKLLCDANGKKEEKYDRPILLDLVMQEIQELDPNPNLFTTTDNTPLLIETLENLLGNKEIGFEDLYRIRDNHMSMVHGRFFEPLLLPRPCGDSKSLSELYRVNSDELVINPTKIVQWIKTRMITNLLWELRCQKKLTRAHFIDLYNCLCSDELTADFCLSRLPWDPAEQIKAVMPHFWIPSHPLRETVLLFLNPAVL